LNQVTKKNAYSLLYINEMFDLFEDAKYFFSLNLFFKYWKVVLSKENKKKTAFVTKWPYLYYFNI
ncbi:hypothetical protein C1645_664260, partial [Glomus cerebriforme]